MVGTTMPRPKTGRRILTEGKRRATVQTSAAPGGRRAVTGQRQRPLSALNDQAAGYAWCGDSGALLDTDWVDGLIKNHCPIIKVYFNHYIKILGAK